MLVWVRAGDQDDYHSFDDLESAADYLEQLQVTAPITRHLGHIGTGIEADGFRSYNMVSIYWGDEDVECTSPLTDDELADLNKLLDTGKDVT